MSNSLLGRERWEGTREETMNFRIPDHSHNIIVNSQVTKNFYFQPVPLIYLSLTTKYICLDILWYANLPVVFLFSYPSSSNFEDMDASILDALAELISENAVKAKPTPLSPKSVSSDI